MAQAREVFEASADFTVGIEEEFQILDPETRSLDQRFAELHAAAQDDDAAARGGRRRADRVRDRDPLRAAARASPTRSRGSATARARLFRLARRPRRRCWAPPARTRGARGRSSGSSTPSTTTASRRGSSTSRGATTPSASTSTSGVRGADRAIAVCDRLRPMLPELLAISANSPFLDGRDSGLHIGAHADLHQELPALRDPGRRSATGPPTRSTSTSSCARARSSRTPSSGGACARITRSGPSSCGSATRRRRRRRRRRWPG